jgi:predicted Zn-dependent protease
LILQGSRRRPTPTARAAAIVLAVPVLLLMGVAQASAPDPLLAQLESELDRWMGAFDAGQRLPPYYVALRVTDRRTRSVAAGLGALHEDREGRLRVGHVQVRVGDHALDNTHELRGMDDPGLSASGLLPVDPDPAALRHALWVLAEEAYELAVNRYQLVLANTQVRVASEDESADFTAVDPQVFEGTDLELALGDMDWSERVRELSTLAQAHPRIEGSTVRFEASVERRYLVDNAGMRLAQSRAHAQLSAQAVARAPDGEVLSKFSSFEGRRADGLPGAGEQRSMVEGVLNDLEALLDAPVVEPATVPAILRGRAAGVFFHEVFGHRVEGHRLKLSDEGQTFADKVGQRVTAPFLDVFDDPNLEALGGEELNGFYRFDDEGVAARRVPLIEDGVLVGFLLGRSPLQQQSGSNGHGRSEAGQDPVARQANLVVEASELRSYAALRQLLLEEVRSQGKPFGLIFEDIQGGYTNTGRWGAQSFKVLPVMVYRVYPDGRSDELVRGVDMVGTPLQVFERIVAAADDLGVFNGMCGAESGWVPVSAAAPSLLLSGIEIEKRLKGQDRPPLLPAPGPGAGGGS